MNLSKNVKVTLVAAGAVSAGTAINSTAVDMSGFEGVIFVGSFATANAGNTANAAQSSTSGGSYADLAGTEIAPGGNGDSFLIDVYRPTDRFVRCEIDRSGADTITGDVYAIQYGAASKPTVQGATIDAILGISPAEVA